MHELILIQGAGQATVERMVRKVAEEMMDPKGSITALHLFATRREDTYAVRPSRLCNGWDFSDLCLHMKACFADTKEVRLQAWFQLTGDTMCGMPVRQLLYVGFEKPSPDDLTTVDPQGNNYEYYSYTDEESGEEYVQAEPSGTALYEPCPKLQLKPLPGRAGHYAVGKPRPAARLRNLYDRAIESDSEWVGGGVVIASIVAFFSMVILALMGAWDYSETVLPMTLPLWLPFVLFGGIGALLAGLNVTFKQRNLWGRFVYNTIATAMVAGLMMIAVFSTNKWFHHPEPVYGQGVVVRHVENNGSHNYHIDVLTPTEGTIFFRMQHDGTLRPGDTVRLTMHTGFFGMMHVETVE